MMTLYHEINHAIYCQEMGTEAYKHDYELEMERCIISDLDPYEDNYYEVAAEEFAKQKTREMLWVK